MGQMQAASAQAASARYNATVQQNNATIARDNAADALKRGQVAQDDAARKTASLKGRQIAVMAANNLDVTSGSPLDILGDTSQLGQWDVATTRDAFGREARGHLTQAMNFTAESELSLASARNAKTAGTIGAMGTLASGIGSVASSWYKMAS